MSNGYGNWQKFILIEYGYEKNRYKNMYVIFVLIPDVTLNWGWKLLLELGLKWVIIDYWGFNWDDKIW